MISKLQPVTGFDTKSPNERKPQAIIQSLFYRIAHRSSVFTPSTVNMQMLLGHIHFESSKRSSNQD